MLKLEELTKYYGKNRGIEDVNLEIKTGEIFGFIGPNGAGKSTTIRTILEFIKKDKGLINLKLDKFKEEIGYLPAEVNLYDDLTVLEMLKYNDSFYNNKYFNNGLKIAKRLALDTNKIINELSFGNLKKLGIVLALMHNPQFIILDEPTSGLDPLMQNEFFDILEEEKEKGKTIFFSSHNLPEIKKICDRVAIIKDGKIVDTISIKDLTNYDFCIVTIKAPNIKKVNLPLKNMQVRTMAKDEINFIYKGNINDLISILKDIKLDKLLIEESTIEDIFLHYYKEDYNDKV